MRNNSIPQKINLASDKALERFLRSPAKDESALRNSLVGKNTLAAVKIIADEFVKRFDGRCWPKERVIKGLVPGGRAVSWTKLDENICRLCQHISILSEMVLDQKELLSDSLKDMAETSEQQIEFFDKIRYIIRYLPRVRYKPPLNNPEKTNYNGQTRKFVTCDLCWRAVPLTGDPKKTHLCYEHDIMSTSNEYRRRKNMRKRMEEILNELEDAIPTPSWVLQNTSALPQVYYFNHCRTVGGHFPFLTQYLYKLELRMTSPADLVWALAHPIPLEKLTATDKADWEFYVGDQGAYFELNYERLLLAEAWLRAEAEYKHGGKRIKSSNL